MAKKRQPMSDEQKKHLSDMAKARWAKTKTPETKTETSGYAVTGSGSETFEAVAEYPSKQSAETGETISSEVDIAELQRQIQELKDGQFADLVRALKLVVGNDPSGAQVANGRVIGTFEKYMTAADRYPNPVFRLKEEPKLARFAFPLNYDLNYEVGISEYETIDGIRTKEPKFQLELVRIMMDEETGEPTDGRYIICRLIMHEDPEAAMVIAHDNGLEVETEDEEFFLNEMRYIRMRDWLFECFYPSPVKAHKNLREMVINGRLVTYYEVNDEQSQGIDFSKVPRIAF